MGLTTAEALQLTDQQLWDSCDHDVRKRLGAFIREFNKREWSVRIGKTHESFEDYTQRGYTHHEDYGTGFVVNGRPVPYFHPNRSFHDEIIWLNSNLYYNPDVSFTNKLVNSAVVKFYGPSRTLNIITGHASDLGYLEKTDKAYIDFDRLREDEDYEYTLMRNIELASMKKQQLWGTTELRTSLQKSSRDHARKHPSPIDRHGVSNFFGNHEIKPLKDTSERKMRTSDMIWWIKSLTPEWVEFFSKKPTMQQSYEFLTSYPGIGAYYGYHFSSNLARMPGVGSVQLIDREYRDEFAHLQAYSDTTLTHGGLDENADYVVAGPGACATLKSLWPNLPINTKTTMKMILSIRDQQEKYFDICSEIEYKYLNEASELGRFTTFGIEIGCCQFSVFTRLRDNPSAAASRANAPISKEVGKGGPTSLESFFG